jgi:hypothetical protein
MAFAIGLDEIGRDQFQTGNKFARAAARPKNGVGGVCVEIVMEAEVKGLFFHDGHGE